jgi:ABC-type uncharacterized transport system ATPase subunit
MAGRVIFINRGRVVFDGTPAEMQAGYASLDDAFRALTEGAAEGPIPWPGAPTGYEKHVQSLQ